MAWRKSYLPNNNMQALPQINRLKICKNKFWHQNNQQSNYSNALQISPKQIKNRIKLHHQFI